MFIRELLPSFIINLRNREERLGHILREFNGRDEFDITIISGCRYKCGAMDLWNSIVKIIDIAIKKEYPYIILCRDNHQFTNAYQKEYFLNNVLEAESKGVDILLGGMGECTYAMPISSNRFWIEHFLRTPFLVIFENLFEAIKAEDYCCNISVDEKLSSMTINKMVIFPFISVEKEFGYSDITTHRNPDVIANLLKNTTIFLSDLQATYNDYTSRFVLANDKQF